MKDDCDRIKGFFGGDGNGNWIVGYGVSGLANIVVTPDHVEFGSARSEPFSPKAKAALAELRPSLSVFDAKVI